MMKKDSGGSFIASLPRGTIVTVKRADGLSPTMLVAQCRDKEFIIFEKDLGDAIPLAEAQDDFLVLMKRAAG